MFRVLEIPLQGTALTAAVHDDVGQPVMGQRRWIDLSAQDAEKLAVLSDKFGFHPLTIEDCLHFDQRPKIETYDDYAFIVLHAFRLDEETCEEGEALELHMFLGNDYLVTVHQEPMAVLESVWERVRANASLLRRGPDHVCYLLADAMVDAYFPLLDAVSVKVDQIEDNVLDQHRNVELGEIFAIKRLLVTLRRVLSPQRDVIALLAKRGEGWISEQTSVYFRDVYDHVIRLHESVDATRDLISNALDAYLWAASQRTNEIMKRLTVLSAIFMPLTFITGYFGQNFTHLPIESTAVYYGMIAACLVIPIGMATYFARSKWF